jgi:hypothetical protein
MGKRFSVTIINEAQVLGPLPLDQGGRGQLGEGLGCGLRQIPWGLDDAFGASVGMMPVLQNEPDILFRQIGFGGT